LGHAAEQRLILRKAAAFYASLRHALSTNRNYSSHALNYTTFAVLHGHTPILPITDDALSEYLIWANQTAKPASLRIYMTGLRTLSLDHGFPWPHLSSRHETFGVYQALKRYHGTPAQPKLALELGHFMKFRRIIDSAPDSERPMWICWWAAALTAFFLMLRKDNVTIKKADTFHDGAHLCVKDFKPEGRKSGTTVSWHSAPGTIKAVVVTIRKSKTNQFHERSHPVALAAIEGSPLCPVEALRQQFLLTRGLHKDAPAFQVVQHNLVAPMTHQTFVSLLHGLLTDIGLVPTEFSGHSFRRGGATLAYQLTQDEALVAYQGDWSSLAVRGYNQRSTNALLTLPRIMANHIAEGGLGDPVPV
jgi:hypothetical protein